MKGQADCLAFLLLLPEPIPKDQDTMTETLSKSRLQAEKAFAKVQSQFLARTQMTEELDLIVRARDEKTLRLRTARLAKELSDRQSATAAFILRRDA